MAITKQQKTEILQELVDKFGRSKSVVFSDYRGLDVASVSDLRNKLREKDAETKVAKKTLIKLAAKESGVDDLGDDMLTGPVSATFSYEDEMTGLKVLFNFSKTNENLKLLGGVINGKVVGAEEIIQLAKLPGREELLAKLMGSMSAPVSGFVGILGNLLGGFVRVLNAYKETLPAEEAPAEEVKVEEASAEETPAEPEAKAPAEATEEPVSDDTAETEGDAVETDHDPSQEEEKKGEETV
ncbi:50S ribosomal protein L10 [Patescibacteria group bacterium]|nr:50S ribosomal protein L10 [Patescibacteria group bacterium]